MIIFIIKKNSHESFLILFIIFKNWSEVINDTIKNCWNHVKILSNIEDDLILDKDLIPDDNLMLDEELNEAIKALHLPNIMQVKEFLTIPEEDIVYDIPNMLEFVDMFKNGSVNHPDEIDDSTEIEIISVSNALQSLKTLNLFLLQQEKASEQVKLVGKIEKFSKKEQINSMQQTTIDRYFR